jgi:hypothetical protein
MNGRYMSMNQCRSDISQFLKSVVQITYSEIGKKGNYSLLNSFNFKK